MLWLAPALVEAVWRVWTRVTRLPELASKHTGKANEFPLPYPQQFRYPMI